MSLLSRLWAALGADGDPDVDADRSSLGGVAVGVYRDSRLVGLRVSDGQTEVMIAFSPERARRVAASVVEAADALEVN